MDDAPAPDCAPVEGMVGIPDLEGDPEDGVDGILDDDDDEDEDEEGIDGTELCEDC